MPINGKSKQIINSPISTSSVHNDIPEDSSKPNNNQTVNQEHRPS